MNGNSVSERERGHRAPFCICPLLAEAHMLHSQTRTSILDDSANAWVEVQCQCSENSRFSQHVHMAAMAPSTEKLNNVKGLGSLEEM